MAKSEDDAKHVWNFYRKSLRPKKKSFVESLKRAIHNENVNKTLIYFIHLLAFFADFIP